MSTANHIQGKDYFLEFFDTTSSTWKLIGGINNKETSFDNPAATTTNQSTTGDMNEAGFTGYSDFSISGSGVADIRDTASAASYKRFADACQTGDREVQLRMRNSYITHSADFIVTNYSDSTEQNGFVQFNIAAQVAGNYSRP